MKSRSQITERPLTRDLLAQLRSVLTQSSRWDVVETGVVLESWGIDKDPREVSRETMSGTV